MYLKMPWFWQTKTFKPNYIFVTMWTDSQLAEQFDIEEIKHCDEYWREGD